MTGFRAKPSLFQDLRHGDELDMERHVFSQSSGSGRRHQVNSEWQEELKLGYWQWTICVIWVSLRR